MRQLSVADRSMGGQWHCLLHVSGTCLVEAPQGRLLLEYWYSYSNCTYRRGATGQNSLLSLSNLIYFEWHAYIRSVVLYTCALNERASYVQHNVTMHGDVRSSYLLHSALYSQSLPACNAWRTSQRTDDENSNANFTCLYILYMNAHLRSACSGCTVRRDNVSPCVIVYHQQWESNVTYVTGEHRHTVKLNTGKWMKVYCLPCRTKRIL